MAMASGTSPQAIPSSLARGKAYYDKAEYSKAEAVFKKIANSCACGVQVRSSSCCCKSLVPAFADGTVEAELRKKCICSAKSDVRCKNPRHIDALDGLAAVCEAIGLRDLATMVAEAMINLAPREPKGFLRLGRLLRLQHSYRQALQTYQQGMTLVARKDPAHRLLPTLLKMRDKVKYQAVATDPLPLVPLELAIMIFRYLDLRSLCHCLRVSKSWRSLLLTGNTAIQSLWRSQHFICGKKAITVAHLKRYAGYAGSQVTRLAIQNYRDGTQDEDIYEWIAASCRHLKDLKLQAHPDFSFTRLINRTISTCQPQLTSLYLGFYTSFDIDFVNKIPVSSAETLQELTILNLPWLTPFETRFNTELAVWPVLPRLRTLRLGSPLGKKAVFNISSFMWVSPNVEEVWLEGASVVFRHDVEHPTNPWPHLKRLFVGQNVGWQRLADAPFPLPSDIEELHLMHCDHIFSFLLGPFLHDSERCPERRKLRKLTLRDRVPSRDAWPGYMERWVRPGLESGSLRELGVMFRNPHPPWLRSDKLRFLSLKGLSLEFGSMDPSRIDDALADLLERFPNLEGLDVAQEPFSNAALARAVKKGVRLIYYRGGSHGKIEVREWALEKHGARIVEGDYIVNLPMYPEERYKSFY
ncbi:hypothetical protein F4802DRAFT_380686 [Xylaria palmicola]|nr:hypothetical protein F4802DRAFT_380686 [Xylaria palmicola]